MKVVGKLLFVFFVFFISACDESDSECVATELEQSHTGWKETDCVACHTENNTEGAPLPHDDYPIPDCAACHGANGACAPSRVEWHPMDSCGEYNCHGAVHGFTDNGDCWKCHAASTGVFQCTVY